MYIYIYYAILQIDTHWSCVISLACIRGSMDVYILYYVYIHIGLLFMAGWSAWMCRWRTSVHTKTASLGTQQILSQKRLQRTEMEDKWRLSAVSDHILIYPWQNIQKLFQILEWALKMISSQDWFFQIPQSRPQERWAQVSVPCSVDAKITGEKPSCRKGMGKSLENDLQMVAKPPLFPAFFWFLYVER